MLIMNSVRIKRINELNKGFSEGVFLAVRPFGFHNQLAQLYQTVITLRITF